MIESFLLRLLWAFLLIALQVLVFNHIHLVGHAVPLVYIYLILQFPKSKPRWQVLCWGFLMGFVIDIFTNTPGVASSCMTLLAMVQPLLLKVFASRISDDETWKPSAAVMGWGAFSRYAGVSTFIYIVLYFTLETFSFAHGRELLYDIGGSFVLTLLLLLSFERIRSSKLA